MRLFALFNAFDTPNAGGIQVSARIAWDAIRSSPDIESRALFLSLEQQGRLSMLASALRADADADVVLFWHLDFLKLAPLLRLERRCKRVLFLHGTEAWREPDRLTRRALRHVDVVLANTAYTAKRAAQHLPGLASVPTRIIHLGLDSPHEGAVSEPAAIPAAAIIARLHPDERYKGHDELLAAWPLVRRHVPDAQLWIIGEGGLRGALEEKADAYALGDAVRFFGRASDSEKSALLERARCLVMPSTGEGFGLVYLEAMRLGRPCLTGVDGGREVINPPEAGLSVTHRGPQEIADAVVRLLTMNDDWRRRSADARARYEREYTAVHFSERLLGALREAAR